MKSLMLQGTVEGELVANLPYQCILNIKFFENLGIGSPRFWCSDFRKNAIFAISQFYDMGIIMLSLTRGRSEGTIEYHAPTVNRPRSLSHKRLACVSNL